MMNKIVNEVLKEEYYFSKLSNGLDVFIIPKKNLKTVDARLVVKYGALNQDFYKDDKLITTPAGIAHYLEHLMFAIPGGDITNEFSSLGAEVNAYTSLDETCYYLKTVKNVDKCINLLLDFVLNASFSALDAKEEYGIIKEELLSSSNDVATILYQGMLSTLFNDNLIKYPVVGTLKSLKSITYKDLRAAYENFYRPDNMAIFVCGDIDVNHIFDLIKNNQAKYDKPKNIIKPIYYKDKSLFPYKKRASKSIDMVDYRVGVGLKVDYSSLSPYEISRRCAYITLYLDYLFSSAGIYFNNWLKDGIVDYSNEYSYSISSKYGYIYVESNTSKPKETIKAFKQALKSVPNITIDKQWFEHYIHCEKAIKIRKFNSIPSTVNYFISQYIDGIGPYDDLKIMNELTLEESYCINDLFKEKFFTSYIVKQKK